MKIYLKYKTKRNRTNCQLYNLDATLEGTGSNTSEKLSQFLEAAYANFRNYNGHSCTS